MTHAGSPSLNRLTRTEAEYRIEKALQVARQAGSDALRPQGASSGFAAITLAITLAVALGGAIAILEGT